MTAETEAKRRGLRANKLYSEMTWAIAFVALVALIFLLVRGTPKNDSVATHGRGDSAAIFVQWQDDDGEAQEVDAAEAKLQLEHMIDEEARDGLDPLVVKVTTPAPTAEPTTVGPVPEPSESPTTVGPAPEPTTIGPAPEPTTIGPVPAPGERPVTAAPSPIVDEMPPNLKMNPYVKEHLTAGRIAYWKTAAEARAKMAKEVTRHYSTDGCSNELCKYCMNFSVYRGGKTESTATRGDLTPLWGVPLTGPGGTEPGYCDKRGQPNVNQDNVNVTSQDGARYRFCAEQATKIPSNVQMPEELARVINLKDFALREEEGRSFTDLFPAGAEVGDLPFSPRVIKDHLQKIQAGLLLYYESQTGADYYRRFSRVSPFPNTPMYATVIDAMAKRWTGALLRGGKFIVSAMGDSTLAGADNCYYDNWLSTAQRQLKPVLAAAGVQLEIRNQGHNGGFAADAQLRCAGDLLGLDADIAIVSFPFVKASAKGLGAFLLRAIAAGMLVSAEGWTHTTWPEITNDLYKHGVVMENNGFNYEKWWPYTHEDGSPMKGQSHWERIDDMLCHAVATRTGSTPVLFRNWHPGPLGHQVKADGYVMLWIDGLVRALDIIDTQLQKDPAKGLAKLKRDYPRRGTISSLSYFQSRSGCKLYQAKRKGPFQLLNDTLDCSAKRDSYKANDPCYFSCDSLKRWRFPRCKMGWQTFNDRSTKWHDWIVDVASIPSFSPVVVGKFRYTSPTYALQPHKPYSGCREETFKVDPPKASERIERNKPAFCRRWPEYGLSDNPNAFRFRSLNDCVHHDNATDLRPTAVIVNKTCTTSTECIHSTGSWQAMGKQRVTPTDASLTNLFYVPLRMPKGSDAHGIFQICSTLKCSGSVGTPASCNGTYFWREELGSGKRVRVNPTVSDESTSGAAKTESCLFFEWDPTKEFVFHIAVEPQRQEFSKTRYIYFPENDVSKTKITQLIIY